MGVDVLQLLQPHEGYDVVEAGPVDVTMRKVARRVFKQFANLFF